MSDKCMSHEEMCAIAVASLQKALAMSPADLEARLTEHLLTAGFSLDSIKAVIGQIVTMLQMIAALLGIDLTPKPAPAPPAPVPTPTVQP